MASSGGDGPSPSPFLAVRKWPGSLCGCLTYEHPYDHQRSSGMAQFLFACVCPTALASNEHALHDLLQADGRTGVLSGQVVCSSDAEVGSCESGRAAARQMHVTAWFTLLLPLLWPILALLSFFQRLHVVKVFRISSESPHMTACKAMLCMPCSLWQVHNFLHERRCEKRYHAKIAEHTVSESVNLGVCSEAPKLTPPPHKLSSGLPHSPFSITSSEPGSVSTISSNTSAPHPQSMQKGVSIDGRGNLRQLLSQKPLFPVTMRAGSTRSELGTCSRTNSVSTESSYQEVTAAFIAPGKGDAMPPVLASIVEKHQTPRSAFNSSPRHRHFDERHVFVQNFARDPCTCPAPWDVFATTPAPAAAHKTVDSMPETQASGPQATATDHQWPSRACSLQELEQGELSAKKRWVRISNLKADGQEQSDPVVALQSNSAETLVKHYGASAAPPEQGRDNDSGNRAVNVREVEQVANSVSFFDSLSPEKKKQPNQPPASQKGLTLESKAGLAVAAAGVPAADGTGIVTAIKGPSPVKGTVWAALRSESLSTLNKDLWEEAAQTTAHRHEAAAATNSPVLSSDRRIGSATAAVAGADAAVSTGASAGSSVGRDKQIGADSPPLLASLSEHRPEESVAAAAAAKSLRSQRQKAWKKAFDASRKLNVASAGFSSDSAQNLEHPARGTDTEDVWSAHYGSSSRCGDSLCVKTSMLASGSLRGSGGINGSLGRSNSNSERNHAVRSTSIRGSPDIKNPSSQSSVQHAHEQLSRHTCKASKNMTAILGAGHGTSPAPAKVSASKQGPKSVPERLREKSKSPRSQSPTDDGFAGSVSPSSRSPGTHTPPHISSWAAATTFGFWRSGGSQRSSPTSAPHRTASRGLLQRAGMSSRKPSPDARIDRDRSQARCNGPQSLPAVLGRRPQFLGPATASAALSGTSEPDSSYRDGMESSHHSTDESEFATMSGNMEEESMPRSGGAVHIQTPLSAPERPQEKAKSSHSLLQNLQAVGSVVNSAIGSYSTMSRNQFTSIPKDHACGAISADINQYQSSFNHEASSMNQAGSRMRQALNSSLNVDLGGSSAASSDSIVEESGVYDSQSSGEIDWSACEDKGWPSNLTKVVESLAPVTDSTRLAGRSHTFNNPLTFAPLRGGDDDTPTAQFVPDRAAAGVPRPMTEPQRRKHASVQPATPKLLQMGLQPKRPNHLDPLDENFWTVGDAAGQQGHEQSALAVPQALQHGVGGLPAINEVPVMQVFSYTGTGGMPLGMPASMPGVLGAVEDSGALAFRAVSGEEGQETWRKQWDCHALQSNIATFEAEAGAGQQQQNSAADVLETLSGDIAPTGDNSTGLIRRFSDVMRDQAVPMPESNANEINIARLIEHHVETPETLNRSCSGTIFSTHNSSLSDLDF